MDIEFDPTKAQAEVRKHRVSFAHAEQALGDALAMPIEDPDAEGEQRFISLAMDALGRYGLPLSPIAEKTFASSPHAKQVATKWSSTMRKEYDFSQGKRGAVLPSPGKTRITIMIDNDILEFFRARAEATGTGYQTMINSALRATVAQADNKEPVEPLTVEKMRQILREELHAA